MSTTSSPDPSTVDSWKLPSLASVSTNVVFVVDGTSAEAVDDVPPAEPDELVAVPALVALLLVALPLVAPLDPDDEQAASGRHAIARLSATASALLTFLPVDIDAFFMAIPFACVFFPW
jgi:hypothetical protein